MDPSLSGHRRRADALFLLRAEALASFVRDHGRFPSARADDVGERALGRWLSSARSSARGFDGRGPRMTRARSELLDSLVPGWGAVRPGHHANEDAFEARLRRIAADVTSGRGRSTTSDPVHGSWLSHVRMAASGSGRMAWSSHRRALVEKFLPGFLQEGGSR